MRGKKKENIEKKQDSRGIKRRKVDNSEEAGKEKNTEKEKDKKKKIHTPQGTQQTAYL